MTDKELIRALRKVHDATFTPGVYEHSIYGVAADRLEALLAENAEMNIQIQKEICKRVKVEAENEHLREVTKMIGKDTNVSSKWVSVTERLPEGNSTVLVYRPGMTQKILLVRYGKFWENGDVKCTEFGYEHGAITHWCGLPEPPSTEGVE